MTDAEIGAAINAEIRKYFHGAVMLTDEVCELMGRAARKLLANPVATREGVKEWYKGQLGKGPHEAEISLLIRALSQFAPPRQRMMIEGMDENTIYAVIRDKADVLYDGWRQSDSAVHVARLAATEAHRLATTPARQSEMMAPKGDLLTDIHAGLVALMSEVQATWRAEDYPSAVRSDAAQFRHACLHAMKAIGKISALIDHADHERLDEPEASGLRSELPKLLADLLRCAAKMAEKAPFHAVDLADAYIQRAEQLAARWGRPSATTPAPEVDPDTEAKEIAWVYYQAMPGPGKFKTAEEYWAAGHQAAWEGWRAVAAREKGNG